VYITCAKIMIIVLLATQVSLVFSIPTIELLTTSLWHTRYQLNNWTTIKISVANRHPSFLSTLLEFSGWLAYTAPSSPWPTAVMSSLLPPIPCGHWPMAAVSWGIWAFLLYWEVWVLNTSTTPVF